MQRDERQLGVGGRTRKLLLLVPVGLGSSLHRSLPLGLHRVLIRGGVCLGVWGGRENFNPNSLDVFGQKTLKDALFLLFFKQWREKPNSSYHLKTPLCLPGLVQGLEIRREGDLVTLM